MMLTVAALLLLGLDMLQHLSLPPEHDNLRVPRSNGAVFSPTAVFSRESINRLVDSYLDTTTLWLDQREFDRLVALATRIGVSRGSTVIVQVLDGKLYVDRTFFSTRYPWDKLRLHFILGRLAKLLRQKKYPDFEFVLNTHDCPIRNLTEGPIFTVTRCLGTASIPLPQWFRWRDGEFGGWDRRSNAYHEISQQVPWSQKQSIAVFRGNARPSTLHLVNGSLRFVNVTKDNWQDLGRTKLWQLGLQHPELMDVGLFGIGLESSRDLLLSIGSWHYKRPITMIDQAKRFKYAIYVEGACGWADRLKVFLASGMAVLLQETPCFEFFAPLLVPNVHYIPVRNDLGDLVDKIRWAQANDDQVQEIVHNAAEFSRTLNSQASWDYYIERTMNRYSQLFRYRPVRRPASMLFVGETRCPNLRDSTCDDESSFIWGV